MLIFSCTPNVLATVGIECESPPKLGTTDAVRYKRKSKGLRIRKLEVKFLLCKNRDD